MSKNAMRFQVADISSLARSLKQQLADQPGPCGHVSLLNMLARGAGYRNFQHFQAQMTAHEKLENPTLPAPVPEVDYARVRRIARHFDAQGLLVRWPPKFNEQQVVLWVLWSRIPARQSFTERQISDLLRAEHHFGDPALLRREMVEQDLMSRTLDCRDYRRLERQPPPDALALMRFLSKREGAPAYSSTRQNSDRQGPSPAREERYST